MSTSAVCAVCSCALFSQFPLLQSDFTATGAIGDRTTAGTVLRESIKVTWGLSMAWGELGGEALDEREDRDDGATGNGRLGDP